MSAKDIAKASWFMIKHIEPITNIDGTTNNNNKQK